MQHITPKEAYEFLQANPEAVFIDVRSEMEYMFVGHPQGSILIPWVDSRDWEHNPAFVSQVRKASSVNRPIVLICRSGHRSAEAGRTLENSGIQEIYNVMYGFEGDLDVRHQRNSCNGWRFDGLPWSQT